MTKTIIILFLPFSSHPPNFVICDWESIYVCITNHHHYQHDCLWIDFSIVYKAIESIKTAALLQQSDTGSGHPSSKKKKTNQMKRVFPYARSIFPVFPWNTTYSFIYMYISMYVHMNIQYERVLKCNNLFCSQCSSK